MKRLFVCLCVLLVSIFSQATVINSDWKMAGDGLTILDVTNNLKWLDLTETVNLSMDYVSGQLGEGGEYEGWRFATANEVQDLLVSAGAVIVPGEYHADNVAPVEYLFDIWGELGVNPTYGFRTSKFNYTPNGNWVAGAISIGNDLWHPGEGFASEYGIYADPNSYAYASDTLTANALVRKASVVVQLNSPSDFSNNPTTINFDDGHDHQVANTLYLNKGVEFYRDDAYDVAISDWSDIDWKATITPPNVLATIRFSTVPTWVTHLNASFSVPVNQAGAYFGNDEGFDVMTLSAYGENDFLLGSVTVDSNRNGDVDQFIGLSSDEPIYSLRFENDGTSYAVVIDDFVFNTPLPDLIITELEITTSTDDYTQYSFNIVNIGDAPANLDGPTDHNYDNVSVQAFVSQDTIFNNDGDIPFGGSIIGSSPLGMLYPGEAVTRTMGRTAPIPHSQPYLTIKVDWGEVVQESNEENNTAAANKFGNDPITVAVDIKPQSCPNPVNVKSKGVLPVAILGSDVLDVTNIDTNTILLEGVSPVQIRYKDETSPVIDGQECECHSKKKDGYVDLSLKFKTQDVIKTLGEIIEGETWMLHLTGNLKDGTPIEGTDCIEVKNKGKK